MSADAIAALFRALSFVALFQAAGAAIFVALFGPRLTAASAAVRRIGLRSAVAGLVLGVAHYSLEASRMTGELSGVFDLSMQWIVLDSSLGVAALLRTIGLGLVAATIRRESRNSAKACVVGAVLALVAFVFVGHVAADVQRGVLTVLLALHLAIVAFWFGALAPLHVISEMEAPDVAARLVEDFARLAVWLVPVILVAGALMTALFVHRWSVFAEAYGLLLLAKITGFALLMGLAALNKLRYGPALSNTPGMAVAFRRTVAVEYGLICAVLAVTAVMTMFFSPER